MDNIKLPQNRGYLIAGIGAIVALLAFLLLPYVTITLHNNANGSTEYIALTVNATTLAQSVGVGVGQSSSNSSFYPFASQSQGTLWLLPILTVVALVVISLLMYREYPFGKGITAPVANQRRWANFALIGIAALSVLIQIIVTANMNGQFQSYINATNSFGSSSNSTTVSTTDHIGFWLYLLGMLAVAGGIIFMLIQENQQAKALSPAAAAGAWQSPDPYYQQYPTGPQPYEGQPPAQASYYPQQQPYQAQAPTQASYQPQQQPYQSQAPTQASYQPQQPSQPQSYPPQQWPQNPPQSPFPPVQ